MQFKEKYQIFKSSPNLSSNVIKSYEKKDKNLILFGVYCESFKFDIKSKYNYLIEKPKKWLKSKKLQRYNYNELRNYALFSKCKFDDILKDIIDKFNNEKIILFVCSDVIYDSINDVLREIIVLNNKLRRLGKTIPLYSVKNLNDLNKINYSQCNILLGERERQISKNIKIDPRYSITLENLISTLTDINLTKYTE